MSFKQKFCPSPWFHMRITNSGDFEPCRWMDQNSAHSLPKHNIKNTTTEHYFQYVMAPLRTQLLNGQAPAMCLNCHDMEKHGKVSGRQKQFLKIGVRDEYFEKSLASSPMRPAFDYSLTAQGTTDRDPSDWQIDLGNYCNGACVYCHPESSSALATEFFKLGLIENLPPPSWCDDTDSLDKFVDQLGKSKNLHYLHFLGGETVITPGFKKILTRLIEAGLSNQVTIGFTTNLTVWVDPVVKLLTQFQQVNLGMSIESLTPVNDYVRYPGRLEQTRHILDRWCDLGREQGWLMQLRVTPTCLTVHDLHTVYDYAWQNYMAVESCNFLSRPEYLRSSVIPMNLRTDIINNLQKWVDAHAITHDHKIINTRDPNVARPQIVQDAISYVNYLRSAPDESHRMPDLVAYLKLLESNRGNNILDYLPQYEQLFRSHGY